VEILEDICYRRGPIYGRGKFLEFLKIVTHFMQCFCPECTW